MNMINRIKNLIKDEKGSSLVEFALVLPLLIVLTVGGIYTSVSFGQKSILNGVNFMQVRAGSVRSNPEMIAQKAKDIYEAQAQGEQKWLQKAKVEPQKVLGMSRNGMSDFRVVLAKEGMRIDLLINSLSLLSGKKPDHSIREMVSTMTLPMEYVTHKTAHGSGPGSDHSETFSVVDYSTKTGIEDFINKALKSGLPGDAGNAVADGIFKKLVDPKKVPNDHDSKRADKILGTNPDDNMHNIMDTYKYWGLDFKYNGMAGDKWISAEQPVGAGTGLLNDMNPNTLIFMQTIGDHVKLIDKTAQGLSALAFFIGGPVTNNPAIFAAIGNASEAVAKVGETVSDTTVLNNNLLFFETPLIGVR